MATAGAGQGRRGRPAKPVDGSSSAQAFLGAELRRLRLERGMVLADLGRCTGFSAQHIGAVERGASPASEQFVTACDAGLGAGGWLAAQFDAVIREQAAVRHQRQARRRAVPTPAATDGGDGTEVDWTRVAAAARVRCRPSAEVVNNLALITDRHRVLYHLLPAGQMIGPAEAHLGTLAALLRVSPERAGRRLAAMAQETAGLVAWLHHDLADVRASERAYQTAESLLKSSGDRALAGYVTAFRATVRTAGGDYRAGAVYLEMAAEQLGRSAPPMPRAWLLAMRAEVAARTGDRTAALALLGQAERALEQADADPGAEWMFSFDHGRLAAHRGTCLLALGRVADAEAAFGQAITSLPARCVRRRAEFQVKLAATYLVRADFAAAAGLAVDALDRFTAAGSAAGLRSVRDLRRRIARGGGPGATRALDERLHTLATDDLQSG